ncbi:hypothetical protein D3C71_2099710 [compost metagenome]
MAVGVVSPGIVLRRPVYRQRRVALQQFMAFAQAQAEVLRLLAAGAGWRATGVQVMGDGGLGINVAHGCIP